MSGLNSNCSLNWNIDSKYTMNKAFQNLEFKLDIKCSVKGNEYVNLNITNKLAISDLYGNYLDRTYFSAKLNKQKYTPEFIKTIVKSTGTAFSIMSILTIAILIVILLIQTIMISSFWSFVNMLQILFYIPVINGIIPTNLESFLTQYLSVIKITIPYKLLPDWFPNPLLWLGAFLTYPLNDKFKELGYNSLSFLYNFYEELTTWVWLAIFYLLLRFLTTRIPENQYAFSKIF